MARTPNLTYTSAIDSLIGNTDEGGATRTRLIAVDDLASQFLADGPIADEITAFREEVSDDLDDIRSSTAAGLRYYSTYTALAASASPAVGMKGEVAESDAGTHTPPGGGAAVPNSGTYSYGNSPAAGWHRTGDVGVVALDLRLDAVEATSGDIPSDDIPYVGGSTFGRVSALYAGTMLSRSGETYARLDMESGGQAAMVAALQTTDVVELILLYGQSNNGLLSLKKLYTPKPVDPAHCLHLNSGCLSPGDTAWPSYNADWFKAAVETSDGTQGEGAGGVAMMRALSRRVNAGREPKKIFLTVNAAIGDRTITQLSTGNGIANAVLMVRRAASLLWRRGIKSQCRIVIFNHGETGSASDTAYSTEVQALRVTLDTAIKAAIAGVYGSSHSQTADTHMFLVQTSSDENSIGMPSSFSGQMLARNAVPSLIHIVTPRYHFGLIDNTHLDPLYQTYLGDFYGRAINRAIFQTTPTIETSLRVVKWARSGAVWTLRLKKPPDAGTVEARTDQLPANGSFHGFSALDGGAADTISSVVFSNVAGTDGGVPYDATITVTLDGSPGSASTLRYAKNLGTTGLDRPASWGNVVARSADMHIQTPTREMYDWLEIQEIVS